MISLAKKIMNKKDREMHPALFVWGLMLYAIAIIYVLIGVYYSVKEFGFIMLFPFIIVIISFTIDFAIGYRNYKRKLTSGIVDEELDENKIQELANKVAEEQQYPGKIEVKKLK